MHRLVKFVSDLKSGVPQATAPVYSHLIYDVIPDGDKTVAQPDILILEGLNVLQSGMDYPHDPHHVFVSDFVDFSIYVDAPEELLKSWYINRFLKFRKGHLPTRILIFIITPSCRRKKRSKLPPRFGMRLT